MIFPQERQFGAGVKRGWRVALQLQFLLAEVEGKEGFVESSSWAIADVRSDMLLVVVVSLLLVLEGCK